jgi:hypothetical protein
MELIRATASPEQAVRVVVHAGAFLSGKVLTVDGTPATGAAVGWLTPLDTDGKPTNDPGPSRFTVTNSHGEFRLGPVPKGTYVVTGLVQNPRAIGEATLRTGQAGGTIALKPDPSEP